MKGNSSSIEYFLPNSVFCKAGVNMEVFCAFTKGFLKYTANALMGKEIETLALSSFVLTVELATRFLDDYILGSPYFKINSFQTTKAKDDTMNRDLWLKELYEANYNGLYKLVFNRLQMYGGNTADVLDVIQDVFLAAVRKEIYNHPFPKGWLFRTAENVCMNYCKINQRQVNKQIKCERAVIAKNAGSSLRLVDAMEDRTEISDVLMTIRQSLTDEEYELVDQYCIKKDPIGEIADRLNVSETVVRVRIYRIRKKLGKYFP